MPRRSDRPIITRGAVLGGGVGGLAHTALAVGLWNTWYDTLWEMLAAKPLNGAYILLGMFLLGFVPALLYTSEKVISPALIVVGFLLLSGLGSWLAGPARAPAAVPTLFALYILSWVGVVALAGMIGRAEYHRKQRTAG